MLEPPLKSLSPTTSLAFMRMEHSDSPIARLVYLSFTAKHCDLIRALPSSRSLRKLGSTLTREFMNYDKFFVWTCVAAILAFLGLFCLGIFGAAHFAMHGRDFHL